MEEKKKTEWTVEDTQEQPEKTVTIDKEALADYIIERLPEEIISGLQAGKSMAEMMMQWENSKLKKENEILKSKLAKNSEKPLTLAGQGGEKEKDPFAAGFLRAMAEM